MTNSRAGSSSGIIRRGPARARLLRWSAVVSLVVIGTTSCDRSESASDDTAEQRDAVEANRTSEGARVDASAGSSTSQPLATEDDVPSSSESDGDTASRSTPYSPESQPIYRLLAERLGYTSGEVRAAADRERAAIFHACLADAGYDYPTDAVLAIVALPSPATTPVDRALASIRAAEAAQGVSPVPEQALGACLPAVDGVNPFNALQQLVDEAVISVSDRVRANATYIEAQEDYQACVAGGAPPTPDPVRDDIVQKVAEVEQRYGAGQLNGSAAISELQALSTAASTIDWTVEPGCDSALMQVERSLVSEAQQEFLEENPGFIEGIADQYRPVIDGIMESS